VLGEQYVENSFKNATEFTRDLQEIVTEYVWGVLWTRENLPRKIRSLINVALLAALGKREELKLHVKGALRNGCTKDEIKEALLHAMFYAGAPVGVEGFKAAQEAINEYEQGK